MQAAAIAFAFLGLLLVAFPAEATADACSGKNCTLACQPGEKCVLQTVTCIRAPCPPIQTCVAVAGGSQTPTCTMACGKFQTCQIYEPDGTEYCADVCAEGRCPQDSTCELQEVQCIRAPSARGGVQRLHWAEHLIEDELRCVVAFSAGTAVATEEAAVCNLMCVQGMRCELQQVQCITAPCNPIAKCVAVDPEPTCTKKRCGKLKKCVVSSIDGTESCISPCSTVRCASGYTCEVEQVQCIKAPCPPVAVCNPTKKTSKQPYAQRALRTTSNM
ncbi:hypothetical protein BBJ28_00008571 [Nothophytophthora sp. Chile5]|nr:hypothetical protein BBJ28_00008571 [Nothophytophthora sp. Chile5]